LIAGVRFATRIILAILIAACHWHFQTSTKEHGLIEKQGSGNCNGQDIATLELIAATQLAVTQLAVTSLTPSLVVPGNAK
jgi:nitric oxide reductase large subunit